MKYVGGENMAAEEKEQKQDDVWEKLNRWKAGVNVFCFG